ncbi:MAG: DUF5994 family protein [Mycobacterium sp.]
MTRHKDRDSSGHDYTGPENTPRLRLKPKAPMTGHVDGAWWPRSDDLTTELPDLLAVLSVRLGAVERVMYNLGEWARMPRRLMTGGRSVRLDGYQRQPTNTLQVQGVGREKIVLLVVPPDTDADVAHEAMMAAAAPDNASTVADLLAVDAHDGDGAATGARPTYRRRVRRSQP